KAERKNILTRKKKKNILDTHRPSHGRPRAVSLSLSPPPETLQVASLRVVEASMGRVAGKASTSSDATRLDSPGPKSLTFASPRGSPSLTNTISKFLAMRLTYSTA